MIVWHFCIVREKKERKIALSSYRDLSHLTSHPRTLLASHSPRSSLLALDYRMLQLRVPPPSSLSSSSLAAAAADNEHTVPRGDETDAVEAEVVGRLQLAVTAPSGKLGIVFADRPSGAAPQYGPVVCKVRRYCAASRYQCASSAVSNGKRAWEIQKLDPP